MRNQTQALARSLTHAVNDEMEEEDFTSENNIGKKFDIY